LGDHRRASRRSSPGAGGRRWPGEEQSIPGWERAGPDAEPDSLTDTCTFTITDAEPDPIADPGHPVAPGDDAVIAVLLLLAWLVVVLFALALCRAAGLADRALETRTGDETGRLDGTGLARKNAVQQ
jgi:hypothetical protein